MAENMRDIKNRIKSVKQTMQITNAMKLISAVKLRKARQQLEKSAPYFKIVKETLANMLENSSSINHKCLTPVEKSKCRLFFVISGDKGLVGGYNSNLLKITEQILKDDNDGDEAIHNHLFVAGNVGRNYLIRHQYDVDPTFDFGVQNPTVYRARDIADMILEKFLAFEYDEVFMIYTQMISSIDQQPLVVKLLPLEVSALELEVKGKSVETEDERREAEIKKATFADKFEYEPTQAKVFDFLVPKYLKGMIYGAFVEAFTCEQNARMTAMDSATTNAMEMIESLNLYYNRARQANITQEISEIVGGAAALE
ncbi:MAG: ATP synthase F1 subunit gamma [Clostridia bacterium]